MAFATKYTVTWKDVANVTWDLYFQRDGYSGDVETFTPGSAPAVLTYHGGDKYQPIVGSSVDIQLLYESAIDDLYSEESHYTKVLLRRATMTIWSGFLSPGQYFRQFNQPVHFVTLTATDGLGELKNIKFEDSDGDPFWGQEVESVIIANILFKTGIASSINEAVNIFDTNHTTGFAYSPLNQTYMYQEAYWDEQTDERSNCYDVLTDILVKYGATIRKANNEWYILRPNSFSLGTIYFRVFTSFGIYDSNDSYTSYNSVDYLLKYLFADQEITKIAGVGKCEVTQKPPRRENLLKNGSFDEFTWDGSAFDYWSVSGTPAYAHSVNKLLMRSNDDTSSPTEYIYTSVDAYKAKSININFDYKAIFVGTPTYKTIIFQIREDFTGQYLTTSGWSGSVSTYNFVPVATDTDYSMSIDVPEVITGGFDVKTRLIISIYEFFNENAASGNYFLLDNMRIDVDYAVADSKLHSYDNAITINNIMSIDSALGDSWNTEVAPGASFDDSYYVNTFDATSDDLTEEWSITGDPTAAAPLCEVLARQTVEGFRRSVDLFRGTFRTAYAGYFPAKSFRDENIVDEYGFAKSFFPGGIALNTRENQWSGEWIECPATYTDEELEWDSHDCGGDATITGNQLEVDEWTVPGAGDFAYFDSYTAVAGETIRLIATFINSGGMTSAPAFVIDGDTQSWDWGTNYITYYCDTAGAKTIELYANPAVTPIINMTATIDVYSITGI